MSGVVFKDDGQIAMHDVGKFYSLNPRIEVEIEEIHKLETQTDEINQPNPAEHTELTAGSKDTGKAVGEVAQAGAEAKPTETATTESTLGNNEPSGGGEVNAPVIEKNGSEIVVSNQMVGSWLKKED